MTDTDYLYIGNLSPDAKRTVRRWYAKFCMGVAEHGPLDLSVFTVDALLQEGTKELQDWNSYLAMAIELTKDLTAKLAALKAAERE